MDLYQDVTHSFGFSYQFCKLGHVLFTSASFVVLVNGVATNFFHTERGLKPGCPLFLLLSLLIMEGPSRIISNEKARGDFKGTCIIGYLLLMPLLFPDNVLIFLDGSKNDATALYQIK